MNCGGDGELAKAVQWDAAQLTYKQLDNHPCGCAVCAAVMLLDSLRRLRQLAGLDPETGKKVET